jgi:hypothetical protein
MTSKKLRSSGRQSNSVFEKRCPMRKRVCFQQDPWTRPLLARALNWVGESAAVWGSCRVVCVSGGGFFGLIFDAKRKKGDRQLQSLSRHLSSNGVAETASQQTKALITTIEVLNMSKFWREGEKSKQIPAWKRQVERVVDRIKESPGLLIR